MRLKAVKPETCWAPSPNCGPRGAARVDAIVIHHTGEDEGWKALSWLRNPDSKVSAHFLIGKQGVIYQLVTEHLAAWHAGKAVLGGRRNVNARSIGIELVNAGDGKTPFTEAQYVALERLLGYLVKAYDIEPQNVVGHRDVAVPRGRKTDPADNFDWARVRRAVFPKG